MAPAAAVDVDGEGGAGAKNQKNMAAVKSEDVTMNGFKDSGALLIPCCRSAGDPPVVGNPEHVEYEGGVTTECSSSFGDTWSGYGDEPDDGEPEVDSHISAVDDGGMSSRKKKVTAEWRNAVRPIMWRCQWLEMRMKDLSSQILKYDKELAQIKKEKELQQTVSKTNGSIPETLQTPNGHGNSSMQRIKRKRHEDTVDTSLYINKHQILSYYYDKQNKGAETDGLLIEDDCSTPAAGITAGGLHTVASLDAEENEIMEHHALTDILSTIDGVQSQVHLLQDRLSKAHLEEENLAFSEDNTYVRVPRKRRITQKRSFSYQNNRCIKPQKRKNLNIFLKDDEGPAFAARPALPDKETNSQIEGAKGSTEEKGGEWNHSPDTVTGDLLGADNSLPNGHAGDLGKENTDILIDNGATNEDCQQLEKVKHLPSETSFEGQTIASPSEVNNTSAPVTVDDTTAPAKVQNTSLVVKETVSNGQAVPAPMSPEKKLVRNAKNKKMKKKKGGGSASFSKKQSTTSRIQKTESTSATTEPETPTCRSAGKKRKAGNKYTASKKSKTGDSTASNKEKPGESPTAAKKRKTENSSSAAKQQETDISTRSKLRVEKAVLVAVNSRRSQRVWKHKIY